ncbi:hypothetical protein NQP46_02110 [Streptomyces albus]|nr:hypothetical protein NQP46_02110 [Streptomyces albus]
MPRPHRHPRPADRPGGRPRTRGPRPRPLAPPRRGGRRTTGPRGPPSRPHPGRPGGSGSADPHARADTHHSARLLAAHLNAPVTPAFLGGTGPDPAEAVATWRSRGHPDVAVAAHLLAPGFFLDRLRETGARWVSGALGPREPVAELVWERYDVGCGGGGRSGRRAAHRFSRTGVHESEEG